MSDPVTVPPVDALPAPRMGFKTHKIAFVGTTSSGKSYNGLQTLTGVHACYPLAEAAWRRLEDTARIAIERKQEVSFRSFVMFAATPIVDVE